MQTLYLSLYISSYADLGQSQYGTGPPHILGVASLVANLYRPVQKISLFPVAKVKKLESVGRQKIFFGVKLFGHKYTDVLQTASRQMPTAQRMASSLETRPSEI